MTEDAPPSSPALSANPGHDAEAPAGNGNGLLWVLVAVAVLFAVLRPRAPIDWSSCLTGPPLAQGDVHMRQLAQWPAVASLVGQLPIAEGWRAYLAAIFTSQFISNAPATILLDRYVHDLPALAAGVSLGGFGCLLGSLANLIALRLAKVPRGLHEFHRISLPFLVACATSAALLRIS